jgi:Flp pilus assembly pilin Flp
MTVRLDSRGLAIEYLLIAIVVGLVAIFALARFGGSVRDRFGGATSQVAEEGAIRDAASGAPEAGGESAAAGDTAGSAEELAANVDALPPEKTGQDPRAAAKQGSPGALAYATSSMVWIGIAFGFAVVILLVRLLSGGPAKGGKSSGDHQAEAEKDRRQARDKARSAARHEGGQTSFEFLIATLLAIVIILGILQIGLLFNAHSMVKLAAFNAARAAIVARADEPDQPVTIEQMREKAKLAAFLTVFPVIPWIHAAAPKDLADLPGSLAGLLTPPDSPEGFDATDPAGSLPGGALAALEFLLGCVDVKFVDPRAQDPSTADEVAIEETIEFDDRSKTDANLIKVVVTWQYPLVMPFVNRIFIAAMRPAGYAVALFAQSEDPVESALDLALDRIPVWAYGTSIEGLVNNRSLGFASCLLPNDLVPTQRIPVRATYVMRMQWDRKSES